MTEDHWNPNLPIGAPLPRRRVCMNTLALHRASLSGHQGRTTIPKRKPPTQSVESWGVIEDGQIVWRVES